MSEAARPSANRARFTLEELLLATGGHFHGLPRDPHLTVTGLVTDTREELRGSLFLALADFAVVWLCAVSVLP